ncbi:MAG: hypothetical protein U0R76_11525 [Candidatus Nanopelagicales bacterium]
MSRTTRRRAIRAVAPVAGLLAAGLLVWQGSYAAFSATTANGANNWAAGSVSLTDDDAAVAMFSTALVTPAGAQDTKALKPGDTRTNCIKVTNNGTLAGPVKLYVQTYAQTAGLGDNLTVTVEQGTGTAATAFGNCTGFNPPTRRRWSTRRRSPRSRVPTAPSPTVSAARTWPSVPRRTTASPRR